MLLFALSLVTTRMYGRATGVVFGEDGLSGLAGDCVQAGFAEELLAFPLLFYVCTRRECVNESFDASVSAVEFALFEDMVCFVNHTSSGLLAQKLTGDTSVLPQELAEIVVMRTLLPGQPATDDFPLRSSTRASYTDPSGTPVSSVITTFTGV